MAARCFTVFHFILKLLIEKVCIPKYSSHLIRNHTPKSLKTNVKKLASLPSTEKNKKCDIND